MAYDRYDARRGSRERWRTDDRFDRERAMRDQDERGFFERAGDEIASWFGDDDSDRRGRPDRVSYDDRDRGEFRRQRDLPPSGPGRWGQEDEFRGQQDRGYRPMTGDFGRSERDFSRGERDFGRGRPSLDEPRSLGSGGARERSHDPHYAEWRNRQIEELDRDYDEYRRENQSKFESDFGDWRSRRQTKRQMLGQVRDHMEVVGTDNEHVGTVDRVAGDRIILTKSDEDAGGAHHSLPCTMIDRIEDQRVILDCDAEQAKQKWRDENRERALFEREDSGQAGPMILDRSFSGTYR